MSAPPPLGLFQPAQHGHNLATLFLIENSAAMVDRWPDLRDRYLPTLLGTVRKVNPVVPVCYRTHLTSVYPLTSSINLSLRPLPQIQVLWGTSCPVSPSEDGIAQPNSSRQYNQLPEIRFNHQPNNKITVATLFRVTDVGVTCLNPTNIHPSNLSCHF
jgi:hypothetical protein